MKQQQLQEQEDVKRIEQEKNKIQSSPNSSTPSPSKRRSSLMWFFGGKEESNPSPETATLATTAGKNSIITRRGSDPGTMKLRESSSDLTKESHREVNGQTSTIVTHSTSLPVVK